MLYLLLGVAVGIVLGYVAVLLFRPPKLRHPVVCEYWVYLPTEKPLGQDAILNEVVRDNPYRTAKGPAIGPQEGLIFSDIRLHMGLVLRSKNAHVFRPDLFETYIEPDADALSALADSHALQKVRYVSEEPIKSDTHLQVLPHIVSAIAKLAGARLIFDLVSEKLIRAEELRNRLAENGDTTDSAFHVNVIWRIVPEGGVAETRGLKKVGLPELATDPSPADQRILLVSVLEEVAKAVWDSRVLPPALEVEAYQDQFKLEVTPTKRGPYRARVFRSMPAGFA